MRQKNYDDMFDEYDYDSLESLSVLIMYDIKTSLNKIATALNKIAKENK